MAPLCTKHYRDSNLHYLKHPCSLPLVQTISLLTHWGQMTHICISKSTIIGSDNGLLPGWRQAIIGTNAGILLIGPYGTNFSEIFNQNSNIFIHENEFESVVCKMAAILSPPLCVKILIYQWFSIPEPSVYSYFNILYIRIPLHLQPWRWNVIMIPTLSWLLVAQDNLWYHLWQSCHYDYQFPVRVTNHDTFSMRCSGWLHESVLYTHFPDSINYWTQCQREQPKTCLTNGCQLVTEIVWKIFLP